VLLLISDAHYNSRANPQCPVDAPASKAPVGSLTVTQSTTTALTLPSIVNAVSQPDLNPGRVFPIGAVIASKRWIRSPLIGGDIGMLDAGATLGGDTSQEYVYVHTKGAAPAYDLNTPLSLGLLSLPRPWGTPTLIFQPRSKPPLRGV
jgi:RNA-splicing ligase RtcB